MSWRNERSLFKRPCDAPGHTESIISMYDSRQPYKAYDAKYWWSDGWDPLSYGVDYDFSRPFFSQFAELFKRVPLIALSNINSTNSDYTNFVAMNKNCYLCFGAGLNENVSYSNKALESKDSQDLMMVTRAELSYDCTNCLDVYKLLFSDNCKNCTNSAFLYGCRDCTNCFLCTNLVSKSYCILNQQYTKEQYGEKLKEFDVTSYSGIQKIKQEFKKLQLASIRKYSNIISSVNSTGDNIANAKNAHNCFDLFEDVEDAKYLYSALQLKESQDGNGIYKTFDVSYSSNDAIVVYPHATNVTGTNHMYYKKWDGSAWDTAPTLFGNNDGGRPYWIRAEYSTTRSTEMAVCMQDNAQDLSCVIYDGSNRDLKHASSRRS
jgi:hypothetical protein